MVFFIEVNTMHRKTYFSLLKTAKTRNNVQTLLFKITTIFYLFASELQLDVMKN